VGFVVDEVALEQITSVSPANLHSTGCSKITIIFHLGLVQETSSGRSTKWTQSHSTKEKNNKKIKMLCKSVHSILSEACGNGVKAVKPRIHYATRAYNYTLGSRSA
jgi:hypothetical protein